MPDVKPIGRCVELFAALARRRAVGRGIGLLPEVDPIEQCGAVGRGAGRWRARLRDTVVPELKPVAGQGAKLDCASARNAVGGGRVMVGTVKRPFGNLGVPRWFALS